MLRLLMICAGKHHRLVWIFTNNESEYCTPVLHSVEIMAAGSYTLWVTQEVSRGVTPW
jgi:hypothetical protein